MSQTKSVDYVRENFELVETNVERLWAAIEEIQAILEHEHGYTIVERREIQ